MYLSGLSNFVQVLVPILKIYLRLIPEKLVELSNLIKMKTISRIRSKCKLFIESDQNANYFSNLIKYKYVGSSFSKIYSLAPARVQLNYCYTRECQGTKQFRRVISHSRVLMQGIFIPVCSVPVPVRTVCQVYFCVIMYGLFISDAFYDFVLPKPKQWTLKYRGGLAAGVHEHQEVKTKRTNSATKMMYIAVVGHALVGQYRVFWHSSSQGYF